MNTSLKTSKILKEWGVSLESEKVWVDDIDDKKFIDYKKCWAGEIKESGYGNRDLERVFYPTYDILNDICVKYINNFFEYKKSGALSSYLAGAILIMMIDGKQKEAELYILKHCLFNPKNKI